MFLPVLVGIYASVCPEQRKSDWFYLMQFWFQNQVFIFAHFSRETEMLERRSEHTDRLVWCQRVSEKYQTDVQSCSGDTFESKSMRTRCAKWSIFTRKILNINFWKGINGSNIGLVFFRHPLGTQRHLPFRIRTISATAESGKMRKIVFFFQEHEQAIRSGHTSHPTSSAFWFLAQSPSRF